VQTREKEVSLEFTDGLILTDVLSLVSNELVGEAIVYKSGSDALDASVIDHDVGQFEVVIGSLASMQNFEYINELYYDFEKIRSFEFYTGIKTLVQKVLESLFVPPHYHETHLLRINLLGERFV
jgi:hypothetical protein